MQHTLEQFLRALRAADVRVSPAEAIDAARAAAAVGYADRELFKDALCATLAKSRDCVRYVETYRTTTTLTRIAFEVCDDDPAADVPEELVQAILNARPQ